ncbi:ArsR/SmtB family transcription factor [Phenylobacterium sp.]|uniref:ArsR/SmtB family transcription factor n=1 Tax=Phenylobacterium sp. TaxID=1871053 RepID=UPI003D27AB5D
MDNGVAAKSLAALGHEGRLAAFRLLIEAGPEGIPAGEIARRTGMLQNTSSSNLSILASCGLIVPRRDGRSIIYAVSYGHFGELLEYLLQGCRDGRADLGSPFLARLLKASSEGGSYEERQVHSKREDCC